VALVDRVAHGLADEVGADGEDLQVVALERLADPPAVAVLGQRAVDLEMIAPRRELEPVETPFARHPSKVLEGEVGPLAGEQRHVSGHLSRSWRRDPSGAIIRSTGLIVHCAK
jgi:hypothetical protein